MPELSKRQRREIEGRNFGINFETQERVIKYPYLPFEQAGKAAEHYYRVCNEISPMQQFQVRICTLVMNATEIGLRLVEERAAKYPYLTENEKNSIVLAGAYCEHRSRQSQLDSSTMASRQSLLEVKRGQALLIAGEPLLTNEVSQ